MDKRNYELVLVVPTETTEKQNKDLLDQILQKTGGEIASGDFWGKKDLSYPLKKQRSAVYSRFDLRLSPKEAVDLTSRLNLNEKVYRHLLVIKNVKETKAKIQEK